MTTLQFSLFFAALLVAYLLVHYRLMRFERYLKEIAGLKLLNERLKSVSDVLERVRLDTVEERLGALHEDLGRVEGAVQRVERAIARPVVASAEASGPSAGDRIRAAIEQRLLALGYGDLRILGDMSGVGGDDTIEVRVECEKGSMPFKGSVIARNGAVLDVRLRSVAQSFP